MSERQIMLLGRLSPIAGLAVACALAAYLLYLLAGGPVVDLRL
jgi:hypothetical protein